MIVFIFYLLIGGIIFRRLLFTFFQQDEWAIFGNFLYWEKAHLNFFQRLFVYEQDTHLIPLSNFFSYLQFKAFGLTFFPYGITGIFLHALNAFLVYQLARKLTSNRMVSFIAGLLFLINSIPHQAITWAATTIGTAGSTLGVLVALLFFVKHIEVSKAISKYLFLSLIFFLVAFLFKETSIFLFLFYPLFWYFFPQKKVRRQLIILVGTLLFFGAWYGVSRLVVASFWMQTSATAQELSQPSFVVYLFRLASNPIRIIAQSVVPTPFILKISRVIVALGYPRFVQDGLPDPYLVETVASDIVSFFIGFFVLFAGFVNFRWLTKQKQKKYAYGLLISLVFIIASSLPFAVIPGKAGYISLFDGRHLYLTSTFVAIAMSIILYGFYTLASGKSIALVGIFAILVSFFGYHTIKINRDLAYQAAIGSLRRSILSQITSSYPVLPQKVVFFIESDKAYYGLPPDETIIPFQSGFGQTLLVWYNSHGEMFPACFFEKKYLYVLLDQNYKECQGRGFGYYRKFDALQNVFREHRLDPRQVIAFRFYSSTNTIVDITEDIKTRLAQEQ